LYGGIRKRNCKVGLERNSKVGLEPKIVRYDQREK